MAPLLVQGLLSPYFVSQRPQLAYHHCVFDPPVQSFTFLLPPHWPALLLIGLCTKSRGSALREGRKHVSKRSTHARPGMHMQQCPAVPQDRWYDTRVLPYNCLHLMAFVLSTQLCLYATRQEKAPLCNHLSPESPCVCWHSLPGLRFCFRGRVWGSGCSSVGTGLAYELQIIRGGDAAPVGRRYR